MLADSFYRDLLETIVFEYSEGVSNPGGIGRAMNNSERLKGVFTLAQERAVEQLGQSVEGTANIDGLVKSMSWPPLRWDRMCGCP